MARHNRDDRGVDQHGELWQLSYQPDWLKRLKISRRLPDRDRRSTVTLFKNGADRAQSETGKVVRTRVRAADGSVDIELSLEDRTEVVESIVVVTRRTRKNGRSERLEFVLEDGLDPPPR